jgi:large subunit ribosomal protein L10
VETTLREPRPEKVAVVEEVRERLDAASAAILTEYRGLAVKDIEGLRRSLTEAGGDYKVYKNTLVLRAIQGAGLEALEPLLTGPTAIAFVSGDVAAVAKVLRDFARANPSLVVKGGLIGSDLIDARGAAALADLPSRDVLLAQFAGLLAAPLQQFASLLMALPRKLAYGLSALIEERGGVPDEIPPAPAEAQAAEAPTAEASAAEAPETEAPETEAPAAEAPEAELPGADAAEPETAAAEAEPSVEAALVEAPATEAPETEAEAPVADVPAAAIPVTDDATDGADAAAPTESAPDGDAPSA